MKRIRLLHTADIHLDSPFVQFAPEAGEPLREAQRRVFESIVEAARQWPADALLIAGDLFDSNHVQEATVAFVIERLALLAPIQVYIAPGNRDPYTDDSPYALELWPDNVTVFTPGDWECSAHPMLPLSVHGMGGGTTDMAEQFPQLLVPRDGRVHVALAHGTERAHQPPSGKCYAPFDAADVVQEHLAYLALGHFHHLTEIQDAGPTSVRYPGTPQGRNFDECGHRYFLQVEIDYDDNGAHAVDVTPVAAQEIIFETHELVCTPSGAFQDLLDPLGDNANRAVQLRLTGDARRPAWEIIAACRDAAQSRFLCTQIINALSPGPIERSADYSALTTVLDTMNERIADAPDPETRILESHARDILLAACFSNTLPDPKACEAPHDH